MMCPNQWLAAAAAFTVILTSCQSGDRAQAQKESALPADTVELSPNQLKAVRIEPVGTYPFPVEKETVGSISFADELAVQVFPPVQGKIIGKFAELGEAVRKGQPLYTIESPDLIQAESSLIAAAGALQLTSRELARVRGLSGISQREIEQAESDEQTAEGALKAARDVVRVYGKSDSDMDQIIASRRVDPMLIVHSPLSGHVTSLNAPPGLLVQPGNPPAPYTVADLSVKWMLANVLESEIPLYHVGQTVAVKVTAYPDRVFDGRISKIYASVDPGTHRVTVRSEIRDPENALRPGMLADFVIVIRQPVDATSLPATGIVREGDGTMTAWLTTDRRRFARRAVTTGLRTDGRVQILAGVHPGELAVTEGAVFLSNMLNAPPSD